MTETAPRELRDVDLLRIELGVIWRLDERGRLPGPEDVVIGVAADGMTAAVSRDVPGPLADRLLDLVTQSAAPAAPPANRPPEDRSPEDRSPEDHSPEDRRSPAHHTEPADRRGPADRPPVVLERCRALLGGEGVAVSGGPSYLVDPSLRFDAPVEVLRSSDPADVRRVRPLPRPDTWEAAEWDDLMAGGEGTPWTVVVEDGQVAAICHTARLTATGAEAGTWTSPPYRGRGYAAATTAVWARLLPGVHVFYSTSADNLSSQGVAARLGLRPLGWFWKLTA
ncbi:GNAT family N-acetyltransferase [Nonomuraea sp. NPDC050643]|uniref:GNAT family N-acetyltransferase n=1 Tax=Nonomuraea sp. NPDC050643 TaxID=3155660 RepID=UPI0033C02C57